MLRSLFIKLVMLAATMGVVFWIGWSVPTSIGEGQRSRVKPVDEPTVSANATPGTSVSQTVSEQSSRGKVEAGKSARASTKQGHPLDLNRATTEDLQQLPGIGPVLAKRALDYRKSLGAFTSVDELMRVKGIGRKKMMRLRPLVMVQTVIPVRPEKGKL